MCFNLLGGSNARSLAEEAEAHLDIFVRHGFHKIMSDDTIFICDAQNVKQIIRFGFSGLAPAGLAFTTDPTIRTTPVTLHGRLHDLSFVLLGLMLLPAMTFLGQAFQDDSRWRSLSLYTWITVALAIPAFILKGIAFYGFLGSVLLWNEIIAARYYATREK